MKLRKGFRCVIILKEKNKFEKDYKCTFESKLAKSANPDPPKGSLCDAKGSL